MMWREWRKIYSLIERDFGFSREREIEARDKLSGILKDNFVSEEEISALVGKEVYVVGFSPTLEKDVELIPGNAKIIAADDAASVLYDIGIKPTIVMTDLDGDVGALLEIKDAVFGIHAHGDNISLLDQVKLFPKKFGTTQIEPLWNVYNFGGFTDGDRGVFLAIHFGAIVHLISFDFENPRIKGNKDLERKKKKLLWAKYLLDELHRRGAKIIWENLK
ncbi:MAG: DUF115 domain-containing protein [Thermoplasmata archaeon]|nr:DUF115 domain-containing protein [Thermoplasmata archaeon]